MMSARPHNGLEKAKIDEASHDIIWVLWGGRRFPLFSNWVPGFFEDLETMTDIERTTWRLQTAEIFEGAAEALSSDNDPHGSGVIAVMCLCALLADYQWARTRGETCSGVLLRRIDGVTFEYLGMN